MKLTTPIVRSENIVMQDLQTEVLLYDLNTNKAYCLNETCRDVYKYCDGVTTFDELRRKTGKNISDEVIWLAIEELDRQDLLLEKVESGISRRTLLQKAAYSAVALPLISMLVAPSAAHAASVSACSADGTPTGEDTFNTGALFNACTVDATPTCCSGTENPDFTSCSQPFPGLFVCPCVCGPQIGTSPTAV